MSEPREQTPIDEELVPADDAVIGRVFWWSVPAIVIIAAIVVTAVLVGRRAEAPPPVIERGPIAPPPVLPDGAADMPDVTFTDVTTAAGLDFVHANGATGRKLLPETMGAGCAFLDFDGDGDQDVLLVNSTRWPDDPAAGPDPTSALYRNDGTGNFENVTAGSGLDDVSAYGVGVAVGDYDGDGDVDVFLSALGPNRLLRNDGGTFTEVTAAAGVAGDDGAWSTQAAGFLDYDNDGDLDLFVCNYVRWSRELDLQLGFTMNGTDRAYGPPKLYPGSVSTLYRNEGDGTFTDVTGAAGIAVRNPATGEPMGKALAVTFADVDRDGFLDLFVANDTVQNFVFRNRGDGTFEEVGAVTGVAFDAMGTATGAMGIDAGDYRNDGSLGVGIGNFANETTSFYVQQADPWQFADVASAEGIGSPSRLKLTFGLVLLDYDLDGRLDLLQANGHLEETINELQPSQHYRQPPQLFWNCGPSARSCFAAVPDADTGDLARPIVGRGAACADIDGDGDLDVLITQAGAAARLLRNDQDLGRHWVRIRLVGAAGNRDAIGARVELTAGGVTRQRRVMTTRSYLSQVELPLTIGLGSATRVDALRIIWPDGSVQTVEDVPIDRLVEIEKEEGTAARDRAPSPPSLGSAMTGRLRPRRPATA